VKYLTIALCFLFTSNLAGQFGLRTKYNVNNFGVLNEANLTSSDNILSSGFEIGIDYWFRLKDKRIEFYPEFSYNRATDQLTDSNSSPMKYDAFNFNLNTNIYFLDLSGDCDCPTFSKEGNTIDKGLHFILSPGLNYYEFIGGINTADTSFGWNIGVGIGMDLGINDLLTVTPFSIFRYHPGYQWEATQSLNPPIENFNLSKIEIGLRIGLRTDYTKPRFGR
jgi:hypothetical protein